MFEQDNLLVRHSCFEDISDFRIDQHNNLLIALGNDSDTVALNSRHLNSRHDLDKMSSHKLH